MTGLRIAVTDHAVKRYLERAVGVQSLSVESVRSLIREAVYHAFETDAVLPHPAFSDRSIIHIKSGDSILFLSIGPNTTNYEADLAVIGVLYEKELTEGRVGMGVTLSDAAPKLAALSASPQIPRFLVVLDKDGAEETFRIPSERELSSFLSGVAPHRATVYELRQAR